MEVLKYLWERRTTVLGYFVIALGIMSTSNLFTETQIQWFLLVNGILTAILGHHNNAVNKKQATPGFPPAQGGFTRLGLVLVLLGTVTLFLTSCGTMLPAARSYDQKVAGAYATLAVVNDTAAILKNSDTISLYDAIQVRTKTREALGILDIAAGMSFTEGMSELDKALTLLRHAQDLMCADRPHEPNCQYLIQRTSP